MKVSHHIAASRRRGEDRRGEQKWLLVVIAFPCTALGRQAAGSRGILIEDQNTRFAVLVQSMSTHGDNCR